jgi:hypothetical protein
MAVTIRKNSRLKFADLVTVEGIEFWDTLILTDKLLEAREDDIIHEVKMYDRIDNLAFQYYNDPILWWVIAVANDIEIVPTQLLEGDLIRIPSPQYVRTQLFSKRKNKR